MSTGRSLPRSAAALLLGLAALSFTPACDGKNDTADDFCGREPALTYENFGKGFMAKHCAGCHSTLNPSGHRKGAPPGVDLDTYAGVKQWAYRTEVRALAAEPDMPPGGGPGPDELARLDEWLNCSVYPEILEETENAGR